MKMITCVRNLSVVFTSQFRVSIKWTILETTYTILRIQYFFVTLDFFLLFIHYHFHLGIIHIPKIHLLKVASKIYL